MQYSWNKKSNYSEKAFLFKHEKAPSSIQYAIKCWFFIPSFICLFLIRHLIVCLFVFFNLVVSGEFVFSSSLYSGCALEKESAEGLAGKHGYDLLVYTWC